MTEQQPYVIKSITIVFDEHISADSLNKMILSALNRVPNVGAIARQFGPDGQANVYVLKSPTLDLFPPVPKLPDTPWEWTPDDPAEQLRDTVRDKVRESIADFAAEHDLESIHVSAAGPDGIEHLTVSMTNEPDETTDKETSHA